MALQYPSEWKFEGVGFSIPDEAYSKLLELVIKVAGEADRPQSVIETFKSGFGSTGTSSSYDWAVSDLSTAMRREQNNAASFVDAYWSTMAVLEEQGIAVPSAKYVNAVLHQHGIPLRINPPHLVLEGGDSILVEENVSTNNNSTTMH